MSRLPTTPGEAAAYCATISAFFLIRAGYLRLRARMTQSWKPITAVVTHAQIEERQVSTRNGQHTEYRPDIIYVYTVGGTDHAGTTVHPGMSDWSRSQKTAAELIQRYSPGARVLAHYNPAKPDHAVLIRDTHNIAFKEALIGFATLLAALVLFRLKA